MLGNMVEVEAILDITRMTTTLSQYEQHYTGAFGTLIKGVTMRALRKPTLMMIDLPNTRVSPRLPRIEKPCTGLSEIGKTTRFRATLEGERRYCGNTGETLNNTPIIMSDREKLATLLDPRTVGAAHLTTEQADEAVALLENEYTRFAIQAHAYATLSEKPSEAASEPKAAGKTVGAAVENSPGKNTDGVARKLDSGMTYGESRWEEDEEPSQPVLPKDEQLRQDCLAEGRKSFKAWRRLQIDWPAQYPDAKLAPPLDAVADLMPLDIGQLMQSIQKSDPERKVYGWLPLMASCSYAQLGALNAESFCERILRCAGHVLTEGNTLLDDEELEMLVVLRMNRDFMEWMRSSYSGLARTFATQNFGVSGEQQ
eukprot:gene382-9428_t